LFGVSQPNVFSKILKDHVDQSRQEEPLTEKVMKAYARMKLKSEKRNQKRKTGHTRWFPKLGELVLVKSQTVSDAAQGITAKFQMPYEGPYVISKVISSAIFELSEPTGKVRGIFNKAHLKSYLSDNPEEGV
jgi:hypothetical protein